MFIAGEQIDVYWSSEVELRSNCLRNVDPIPLLLDQVAGLIGTQAHRRSLHTILTELYANALEHGLLGLDSQLKKSPAGFSQYYEKRLEKLRNLSEGFIIFKMCSLMFEKKPYLKIEVQDSGPGYSFKKTLQKNVPEEKANKSYSGRGLLLVRNMCESFKIHNPGNRIEVFYNLNSLLVQDSMEFFK